MRIGKGKQEDAVKTASEPNPRWLVQIGDAEWSRYSVGGRYSTYSTEKELIEMISSYRKSDIRVVVYEIGEELAYAYAPPTVVIAKRFTEPSSVKASE